MSFSKKIKSELLKIEPLSRCCQIAELSAMANLNGEANQQAFCFRTENLPVAQKYNNALKKTFKISPEVLLIQSIKKTKHYIILIDKLSDTAKFLNATHLLKDGRPSHHISGLVTAKDCCKRAYLRSCFLMGGSITTPEKGYHLELKLKNQADPVDFLNLLDTFGLDGKTFKRRNGTSIYIKESSQIAEFINVCGAVNSYLEYENTKIYKEVRNGVNRVCNCDAANINKTISASQRQIRQIQLIEDKIGISNLPPALSEIAALRRKHPDMNLEELGSLLNPKLSKSGVNHRFRKIEHIAEELF